ncbi:hypothetical protein GGI12_000936 [Dipsacomyces acuminosporus]|nr:hypothetical protein GGI12_000936 [Dipsacomyces acuminosporus]
MNFFRRKIKRDAAAPNSQSFHRQLEEKYDAKMQIEQPVSIKPRLRSYFALRQSLYLSDTKSFDSPRSDIATPAPARMSLCITEPAQLGGITSAGVDLTNGREGRTLVKDSEGSDDKVARRRSILGFSFRDRRGLRKASNSGNDTTADADTAVPEMVLDASGHVSKLMSLGTKRRDSQSSDDSNGGDSDDTLASKNAENMMHRASLDESWLKRNSTGIRRGLAVKRSGSGLKKFVAQPTAIQQARMDEWAADDDEFSPYEYDVSGAYFDFPLLPTIDGSSRGAATTRDASKLAKPGPRLSDASTMVDSKQCSAEQCKRIFVSSVRKLQWHSARYGIAGIMHIRNTMAKANEAYTIVSGGKRLNSYQASIAALANLCANGSDPLVVEGQRSGPFAIPPKQLSAGGSIGGRSGSSKRGSSAGVDKGRASKAGAGSGGSSGASGARDMLHDKPRLGTHDFGKTNPFSSAFSLAPATEAAEIDSGSPASPREVQGNEAQAQLWLPVPQPALAIDDSELLGFGAGDLVSLSPVDGVGPDDGAEDADSPGICSRTHQPYRRRRVNKRAGSGSVGLP